MKKATGIKSVDFAFKATGEGIVNMNGSASVYNPGAGKYVDNHVFPKMRGIDPFSRDENGHGVRLDDKNFKNAGIVVSDVCIKKSLYSDYNNGVFEVTVQNVRKLLPTFIGLVRGYLLTREGVGGFARKSPLYITNFECKKPGLVFAQGSRQGPKGTEGDKADTSMYSYFDTNADIQYTGKGSLSIEELQFLPLENTLGRSMYDESVGVADGEDLAKQLTQYLADMNTDPKLKPEATFHQHVSRVGNILKSQSEAGILLNNDAIHVVVSEIISLFDNLYVRQAGGYLRMTEVLVDYNDGAPFRQLRNEDSRCATYSGEYARYYEVVDLDAEELAAKEDLASKRVLADQEKKRKSTERKADKADKADKAAKSAKTASDAA